MATKRQQEVLDALSQACRDEYTRQGTKALWRWVDSDEKAVLYAPVGGHIAYRLGRSDQFVRSHLQALHINGEVLRYPVGNAQGSSVRWWPVGMYAKLNQKDTTP